MLRKGKATLQYRAIELYHTVFGQTYRNSYYLRPRFQEDTLRAQDVALIGDGVLMEDEKEELLKYGLIALWIVLKNQKVRIGSGKPSIMFPMSGQLTETDSKTISSCEQLSVP